MVSFKLVNKTDGMLTLRASKTRPSLLNALRRSILREVPVLAVDEVTFHKNSSALYDEMLAHRLGLIPLTTDYSTYEYEQVGSNDERSAKSRVMLTLKARGPGMITAEALKSQDPYVKPAYPRMPIVWLEDGQEVEAEMIAVMGKGKEHAKFQPGLAWYERAFTIKVKKDLPGELVRLLPEAVREGDSFKPERVTSETLADAVESIAGDHVSIQKKTDEYLFHVESYGNLPAETILLQAVEELITRVRQAEEDIAKA